MPIAPVRCNVFRRCFAFTSSASNTPPPDTPPARCVSPQHPWRTHPLIRVQFLHKSSYFQSLPACVWLGIQGYGSSLRPGIICAFSPCSFAVACLKIGKGSLLNLFFCAVALLKRWMESTFIRGTSSPLYGGPRMSRTRDNCATRCMNLRKSLSATARHRNKCDLMKLNQPAPPAIAVDGPPPLATSTAPVC